MVVALGKRDSVTVHKTLLITERLKDFTYTTANEAGISTFEEGEWFVVTEIE